MCCVGHIGLGVQPGSGLHHSICTLCASSLFSLPAALTASLRVVDPLQDFQPVWSAVYTPGRPSRLLRGWGGGGWGCWMLLIFCRPRCTHAPNPVQPWGQICQLFLACEREHTWNILYRALSHSLLCSLSLLLSLCVFIAIHSLHTSPEHAERINGPNAGSWRVDRERGGRGGDEESSV